MTTNIPALFSHLSSPILADRKAAMSALSIFPDIGNFLQAADILSLVKFLQDNIEEEECSRLCLETLLQVSPDILSTSAKQLVPNLLHSLRGKYFWCRLYALQLLTKLHDASDGVVQQLLLQHPHAIAAFVDILKDNSYDGVIRNEGLVLLNLLSATQEEICKIFAFEGCFEVLLWIINDELGGLVNAGIVACDCLNIILNMMRGNRATQLYFIETGCVQGISTVLLNATDIKDPNVHTGLSLCMTILSTVAKAHGDALRRAAISCNLVPTLLGLSIQSHETVRIGVEALRCVSAIVSGPKQTLGPAVLNHKTFSRILQMLVDKDADAMLRHAGMGFLQEFFGQAPELQASFASNTNWVLLFSNHIWTAITTGSYDPYSALVLCMLMENKDVRTKLAQDAKVTVSPTPTLLLDFIVRYIASFSILAPATSTSEGGGNMNTGGPSSPTAVLHCKILYRLILTWVHDCPVAAAMTKVDSFIAAIVKPLGDPVTCIAATDPRNVWYYALGVFVVLQLRVVTKDDAWRSVIYHEITIPMAVSTFTLLSEQPEWSHAPVSCVSSLNTAPFDVAFCQAMKTLHDSAMTEMVESFLSGPPTMQSAPTVPSTIFDCVQSVADKAQSIQHLRNKVAEAREILKQVQSGKQPVIPKPTEDISELQSKLAEVSQRLETTKASVNERQSRVDSTRTTLNHQRDHLSEELVCLEKDIEWSSSEIELYETRMKDLQVSMDAKISDILRSVGIMGLRQYIREGRIPRALVPRELVIESEIQDAESDRIQLGEEVETAKQMSEDLLLLLSDVSENPVRTFPS